MEELTAYLLLERGPQPNQRFVLAREEMSIGRSANNEVVIVDPEVSRRHARIVRRVEQFALEDLGSTNGTFLNGHRITHLTTLQDGDVIDLGDSISLRFAMAAAPAAPMAAAAPASPAALSETPPVEPGPAFALPPPPPPVQTAAEWVEPEEDGGDFVYYSGSEAEIARQPDSSEVLYPRQEPLYAAQPIPAARPRRVWLGCLLAILAVSLLCVGTVIFLDAYDQGRLLYCGSLRPIFEIVLGPFGFAPLCS
jgi:predicted component of type VI protein secretion system